MERVYLTGVRNDSATNRALAFNWRQSMSDLNIQLGMVGHFVMETHK